MNPDQDFSLEDYQQYALNTHAFEYHSIKDQQYNKEFWVNIAALVVIVGATLICPPAGIALGAVYGTLEITSAVSGKDWGSGREIDTGERYFRGLLAPLDIIPGVGAAKKFATLGHVNQLHKVVDLGLTTTRAGTPLKDTFVNVVNTAKTEGLKRFNQAKQVAVNKLKKDWDDAKLMAKEASDKADEGARGLGKYIFPNQQDDLALAGAGGDIRYIDAENAGKVNAGGKGNLGKNSSDGLLSIVDGLKVIDGKVGGKISIEDFHEIRKASIHNADADSLILGKYTPTIENRVENWSKAGPDSYIAKAGTDSMYFDLGNDWRKIQKGII